METRPRTRSSSRNRCQPPTPVAQPAELLVTAPPGARLYVNDRLTAQTAAERRFVTPDLAPGRVFYYLFRLEGPTGPESRQVEVTAGASITVSFDKSTGDRTED